MRPPSGTGPLLAASLVLSVGKGVFLATIVVYLLQVAGLSALVATTALTAWGAASAAVAIPTGMLIDRALGRRVWAITALGVAVLIPVVAHLRAPWLLILVLFVAGGLDSVGNVARRVLFAGAGDAGLTSLAWARTVSNGGFALGGLLSVWLLSVNTGGAYELAYLLVAVGYVGMAVCFMTTALGPQPAARPATGESQPRDRCVVAVLTASTAVLTLHATLLTTVLPLWITQHTSVPVFIVGLLVALNSVIVIFGQVPVSRFANTTERALRCFRGSAWGTGGCCMLLGLSAFPPTAVQVVLLVAAAIALTCGEMFEAAGEWGLSATLAAAGQNGLYQSACVLGETTQNAVGPLLVGSLVTVLPVASWPLLIALTAAGRHVATFIPVLPPAERAAPLQALD